MLDYTPYIMNKYLLLTILWLCFFPIESFSQNNREERWASDIRQIKNDLAQKHRNLFFLRKKVDFERDLLILESNISKLDDLGVAMKLQQIIANLGDSHTMLNWWIKLNSGTSLPFRARFFSDGLYILEASSDYKNILGSKIVSINNFPINQIIDSLATLITADNRAIVEHYTSRLIHNTHVLNHFGFSNQDSVVLKLVKSSGYYYTHKVKPNKLLNKNKIAFRPDSISFTWENKGKYFTYNYFQKNRILYVQYNICWSREIEKKYPSGKKLEDIPSFKEFEEDIFSIIKSNDIDKLIIDLRFNSGGMTTMGRNFITLLSKNKMNRKGSLYVVVGRDTYSSAICHAVDFKKRTKATIIGETTMGKPNHYGAKRSFRLKNSGLTVNYSTKYIKLQRRNTSTINPKVLIKTSFEDYSSGVDPVFEWVKKQ